MPPVPSTFVPGTPMPAGVPVFPGGPLPLWEIPAPRGVYDTPPIPGYINPPDVYGYPEASTDFNALVADLVYNREYDDQTSRKNSWRAVEKNLKTEGDTNDFVYAVYNAIANPVQPERLENPEVYSPRTRMSDFHDNYLSRLSKDPSERALQQIKHNMLDYKIDRHVQDKAVDVSKSIKNGTHLLDIPGFAPVDPDVYGRDFVNDWVNLNRPVHVNYLVANGWGLTDAAKANSHDRDFYEAEGHKLRDIGSQNEAKWYKEYYNSPEHLEAVRASEEAEAKERAASESARAAKEAAEKQAKEERYNKILNMTPAERVEFYKQEKEAELAKLNQRPIEDGSSHFKPLDIAKRTYNDERTQDDIDEEIGTKYYSIVDSFDGQGNAPPDFVSLPDFIAFTKAYPDLFEDTKLKSDDDYAAALNDILSVLGEEYQFIRSSADPAGWRGARDIGIGALNDLPEKYIRFIEHFGDSSYSKPFSDTETFALPSHDEASTEEQILDNIAQAIKDEEASDSLTGDDPSIQHRGVIHQPTEGRINAADMRELQGGGYNLDKTGLDPVTSPYFKLGKFAEKPGIEYTQSPSTFSKALNSLVFLEPYDALLKKLSGVYTPEAAARILSNDPFVSALSKSFIEDLQSDMYGAPSLFRHFDYNYPKNILDFIFRSLDPEDHYNYTIPAQFILSAFRSGNQDLGDMTVGDLRKLALASFSNNPIDWFPFLKAYISDPSVYRAIVDSVSRYQDIYDDKGVSDALDDISWNRKASIDDLSQLYDKGSQAYADALASIDKGASAQRRSVFHKIPSSVYEHDPEKLINIVNALISEILKPRSGLRYALASRNSIDDPLIDDYGNEPTGLPFSEPEVFDPVAGYEATLDFDTIRKIVTDPTIRNSVLANRLKRLNRAKPPVPKVNTHYTPEYLLNKALEIYNANVGDFKLSPDIVEEVPPEPEVPPAPPAPRRDPSLITTHPVGTTYPDESGIHTVDNPYTPEDVEYFIDKYLRDIVSAQGGSAADLFFLETLLGVPIFDAPGSEQNLNYLIESYKDPAFIGNALVNINAGRNSLSREGATPLVPDVNVTLTGGKGHKLDLTEAQGTAKSLENAVRSEHPSLTGANIETPAVLYRNQKLGAKGELTEDMYYNLEGDPIEILANLAKSRSSGNRSLYKSFAALNRLAGQGGQSIDFSNNRDAAFFVRGILPLVQHILNSYNARYALDANTHDPAIFPLQSFVSRYGKANKTPVSSPKYLEPLDELTNIPAGMTVVDNPEDHAALHEARKAYFLSLLKSLVPLIAKVNLNFDPKQ